MKLREASFLNDLKKLSGILIYGPDAGHVSELCDKSIDALKITKDNILAIDANDLSDKQDYVFAEACMPSMFGGQKMVIISNASDKNTKNISELVKHPALCASVIVTGGELPSTGSLRKFFEADAGVGTLACYMDDAGTLEALIRNELSALAGIKQITKDALEYMIAHLGNDRRVTRGFLEKIALYVDDTKVVDLDVVEKCLPDSGIANMDDFLFSITTGDINTAMLALDRLLYDGFEANVLLRALNRHFKKLQGAVITGRLPERLFWKVKEKFEQSIRIWNEAEINMVLIRLNELEKQFRIKNMPYEILLRDFVLKVAIRTYKKQNNRGRKC